MALLYAARDNIVERLGSGGVLSLTEAALALDRWRKRARSMACDGLAHGASLSVAIADELAAAIEAAKRREAPMKPNLTLVAAEPSQTSKAAEASRRAQAQAADQARAAIDAFARALGRLATDAAELADLLALPPGPRERTRRLARMLEAEATGLGQFRTGPDRDRIRSGL